MKKRLFSMLVLAGLAASATVALADDMPTSVNAGSKAMLFTFSGLNVLGANAYQGGFGGKFYLLDPLALRASLAFGLEDQAIPAPAAGGTSGDLNAVSVGLNVGAEYHLLKTRVSPYVGGTLGFMSTTTSNKNSVPTGTSQTTVTNAPVTINGTVYPYPAGFNFNVAALGGVEFFIIKELSLSAEYRLGLSTTAPYDVQTTTAGVTTTVKGGAITTFGISAVGVLALAFYF